MQRKSRVVILKGENPINLTVRALKTIESDIKDAISEEKPVLIKPNYLNSKHPTTGVTTDSRIIEGIVIFFKQHRNLNIIIGEGSGFADTFDAFKIAGVTDIAKRWGIKLVDLNKDKFVEVNIPNPYSLSKLKIAKTAFESTIISIPKLKLHRIAGVTLSLKNMMGALASKGSMHRGKLSPRIVDLASILRPNLSVIDGIIAGEGHESSEDPVKMDLVIAGVDPVAVDAVGASVMGINPLDVKHLVLAQEKGLGTCDLNNIEIVGQKIDHVKLKFRKSISSKILRVLR